MKGFGIWDCGLRILCGDLRFDIIQSLIDFCQTFTQKIVAALFCVLLQKKRDLFG